MTNKTTPNEVANYAAMSTPYESPEAANEAIQRFYDELTDLRNKHKVPDLLIVMRGSVVYPDGKSGIFLHHIHLGNELNSEAMAAYAYGQTQAERREIMNKLLDGGK